MKRTLTISLWFALGTVAMAQNPATVRKNAQSAVNSSTQVAVTAKPAPASVKVVAVPVSRKPAVAVKPVVVAAKPTVVQAKPAVAVKASPVPVKPATVAVKPVNQKPTVIAVQPVQNKAGVQAKPAAAVKPVVAAVPAAHTTGKTQAPAAAPKVVSAGKIDSHKPEKKSTAAFKTTPDTKVANSGKATEDKKPEAAPEQSVAQNGRRDPFVSPIVTMSSVGSGCNSGKRCLAIDQINLRGIVKADTGMIAVVVNAAEKAYFLRENDPVFNGFVVKITVDSIVFKETFRDKLGKPLTRDVTKTISRPVA